MPAIALARPSRRATIRILSVAAAAVFVLANIVGGLSHTSRSPALRATDAQIEAFLVEQVRDAEYPGALFAIVRDGKVARSGGIAGPMTAVARSARRPHSSSARSPRRSRQ